MKKIKKIIIVGGGTAGWITALNLLQKTFSEIVVVSSKDIPIIGVGESTTGKLAELINIKGGFVDVDEKIYYSQQAQHIKLESNIVTGILKEKVFIHH